MMLMMMVARWQGTSRTIPSIIVALGKSICGDYTSKIACYVLVPHLLNP